MTAGVGVFTYLFLQIIERVADDDGFSIRLSRLTPMNKRALNSSNLPSDIVLGVDDRIECLELLDNVVRAGGYSFVGARSGAECLTLLTRIVPKVILLDIEMPNLDGFETCRRIRALPALRRVPIAFLTARKMAADVRKGLLIGGNDFIVKPFEVNNLLDRISHWMSEHNRAA